MLYVTDVWAAYFKQNIHRNIKISNTQFRTKYTFSTYQLLSHNSRPKLFCLGYSFHPKDACTDRLKSVCVQTARNRAETRDILTVPLYHGIRALITQPVFNPQTSKLGRGAIKKPFRVGHPRRPLPLLRDSPQWLQIPWIEGVRVRCPTNDRSWFRSACPHFASHTVDETIRVVYNIEGDSKRLKWERQLCGCVSDFRSRLYEFEIIRDVETLLYAVWDNCCSC